MKNFINRLLLETIEKSFHGFGFGLGMSIAFNKFKKEEEKKVEKK